MKLLSVIVTMDPISGGPAQGIRNNISFWIDQGIIPSILSFDNLDAESIVLENIITQGKFKTPWAYLPKAKKWLLANLCNYDVVLIHGLWLYHSYVVTKAIKKLKRAGGKVPRVFVMPHGMLDPYFQKAPDRTLKAIRNSIYWQLIEKEVINSADGILFTCEEELQLAKSTFTGYSPKATYNIGYGIIAPPLFSKTQLTAFFEKCIAVKDKSYLLFFSRIHPKKGIDILLKAYALCYDFCQNNFIYLPDLVIAGPGLDSDYGLELKVLQQQYPILQQKVHFPGMLQGDSKWGALYGAELFVLPSHQENFGIAIVEAMACKTPVLISNKVNIWREIEKGKGGIVVDNNLPCIFESLKHWVSLNISDKEKMGSYAYETYYANFTAEANSVKFVKVLKNSIT